MKYSSVILAAGSGQRVYPLNKYYPKCMLPALGQRIIDLQLKHITDAGIESTILIVPKDHKVIKDYLDERWADSIQYKFIVQEEPNGIAQGLMHVKNDMTESFLVILGDIYFETKNLNELFTSSSTDEPETVLASKSNSSAKEIACNFVIYEDSQRVLQVIEKPTLNEPGIKGCGLYKFNSNIFDAIENTPISNLRNEKELTDAIQTLIQSNSPVIHKDIITEDININELRDLWNVNTRLLSLNKQPYFVAKSSRVHPNAKLKNCVLLDKSEVTKPIHIENSILLHGSKYEGDDDLYGKIVIGTEVIDLGL